MTKEEARNLTVSRFTNLLDGSIVHYARVGKIIDHYEALLAKVKPAPVNDQSYFIQNFIDDAMKKMENDYYMDQDDYDGL
jgi:hypothetical protein